MQKIILDMGCGNKKIRKAGAIGLDIEPSPDVDIISDLNKPLPFNDNIADEIHIYHVLEHLDDYVKTMEEIWRIAKPEAPIYIAVPHYSHPVAYADPSHKRQFSAFNFYHFGESHSCSPIAILKVKKCTFRWLQSSRWPDYRRRPTGSSILKKLLGNVGQTIINRIPPLTMDRLGGTIGGLYEINVTLITVK